jgi:transglutaminase-like putative cysteine protease
MLNFNRRDFLKAGAAVSLAAGLPRSARAQGAFSPQPGAWREFQVVTRLEIANAKGTTQAWIPVPAVNEKEWFKSSTSQWTTNGNASLKRDPHYAAEMVHAEWPNEQTTPFVEVTSTIKVRDRAIDLSKPGSPDPLSTTELKLYTDGTDLIPTDGIVKKTSDRITKGAATDLEKARAIYEWVVENTFRDAKVRGCGIGDIASMLRTGSLGGKCADINALYVGLARAASLPARDVYGVRVAPSKFGYKSLGAGSAVISKAQHCRSEVYLSGFGWVPVDPADVRKVALEEPPANLDIGDPKVVAARHALFGSWETNWLAYNFAHDVALPGSDGPKLGFLMYPQAETAGLRLDCLDPDNFKYTITSRELTAT